MIYLDSSALLKLVIEEQETRALQDWLVRRDESLVSSELVVVEVGRGAARVGAAAAARTLLLSIDLLPMTRVVLEAASTVGGTGLRSLDAIHLASALDLGEDVTAVVAYERRLLDAAHQAGLRAEAPGGPV